MNKRKLDISIISDVHLGDYECHATELLKYLQSIEPKTLILNGDFISVRGRHKKQFPATHTAVVQEVFQLASRGTKVYYITGDKERVIQYFPMFSSKIIDFRNKLELYLRDQKYWIFHGDTFDVFFRKSRWIVKVGNFFYQWLLRSDRMINKWRVRLGKARMCYVGRIKKRTQQSLKAINDFEETAIQLARQQGYDYVICGHIHEPGIRHNETDNASVVYMNSGDWVENLTALEYSFSKWELYKYDALDYPVINPKLHVRSKNTKRKVATKKVFGSIIETNTKHSNNNVSIKIKEF